jgi:hypothetical protein
VSSGEIAFRTGRRFLDASRAWCPEALFLGVSTAAGIWAGGRWLDPAGDPGIWWSLAERLARGERYYRDIFLQYGPFSPYLFSFSGRPFAFSAAWFLLANWMPAILAGVLLLRLSRPYLDPIQRVILAGFLMGISVLAPGSSRLVFSYCPAAVHALCLSIGAFLLLRSSKGRFLASYGAGALAGLALCAKQEIGVAAAIGLTCSLLVARGKAWSAILRFASGLGVVLFAGIVFVAGSGASLESLRYESHVWPIGYFPPEWKPIFRGVAGVLEDDWIRGLLLSVWELLKAVSLVSVLGLLFARERRSSRWWPSLGLAGLLMSCDVLLGRDPLPNVRPIGLSMSVAFLVALLAFFDRRRPDRDFLIGFGLFAGIVGIRTAFSGDLSRPYSGVAHFGSILTWLVAIFCFAPSFLPGGESLARMTRRAWVLVLLPAACYSAFEGIDSLRIRSSVPVETHRGVIWTSKLKAELYGKIASEIPSGKRVLFLPETYAADVLYDLPSASPFLLHAPGWLDNRAEKIVIARLDVDPPPAVVLFERSTTEFRIEPFGVGFGRLLSAWVHHNYDVVLRLRAGTILRRGGRPTGFLKDDRDLTSDEPHRGLKHPLEPEKERKRPVGDEASKPDSP